MYIYGSFSTHFPRPERSQMIVTFTGNVLSLIRWECVTWREEGGRQGPTGGGGRGAWGWIGIHLTPLWVIICSYLSSHQFTMRTPQQGGDQKISRRRYKMWQFHDSHHTPVSLCVSVCVFFMQTVNLYYAFIPEPGIRLESGDPVPWLV